MKSSSKRVVAGAFGGLAAVVVAGSGAFACTADATVGIVQHTQFVSSKGGNTPAVAAGSTMVYKAMMFLPASDSDPRMITVSIWNPFTNEIRELGRAPGPEFQQPILIPSDWYSSTATKPYKLLASQSGNSGLPRSTDLYITGGREWVPPVPQGGTPPESRPGQPVIPGSQIVGTVDNPLGPGAQGVAAAPQAAAQVAGLPAATSDTPPTDQAGAGAPIVPGQPTSAPVPLGPPAPPENNAPPANELWSALRADGSVNLLEPAGGTTPPSSGVPAAGIALLGTGILALAGVAAVGTRGRLVLSRVARRR